MANIQFQLRRGISSEWTSVNPILAAGEVGVETDTNKIKIGNGNSGWTSLSYAIGGASGASGITGPYVTTFNGLTGTVGLSAGTGITLSTSGNTLIISSTAVSGITSAVSSLVGLTGTVGLSAGTGINIATSGNTLTISATAVSGITSAVSSLVGLTGTVGLSAGTGINIATSGNTVIISSTVLGACAGVQSLNGITGTVGLSAGTGINIATSGNTLTISATTGITFTQVGSGAVARTIDSKLKDVFSVKDFGAVGDGITDDRAAIQTALNAMFGFTGISSGTIYFPYGTYKINTAVSATVNKDIKLLGDNATIKHGGTVGAGSFLTLNGATHYIHLENIIFDGDSRTSRIFQSYSSAQSTARILINNCQFLNTFTPGPPDGQNSSLGCYIEGGFKSVILTNSLFKNILRSSAGITDGQCQAFCVTNRGAEPTYAEWVNVTNNVFENILTGTSGGNANTNSNADAVVLFGGRTYGANTIPASSIVANNKFTNCQGRSIKIQGDEATITGNQIYCNVRSIASGSAHINPQIAVGNVSNNIFHFDVTSDGKSPFTEDGLPIAGGVGGIPTKSSTAIGFYTDISMPRPKYYTVRDNIIINNVPANIGIYRGGVFFVSENGGTQESGLLPLAIEPLFVTVDGNSIIGQGESQRLAGLSTRGLETDGATSYAPPSQTALYATITNNYVAKISAPFTGGLTLTKLYGSPEATGGVLLSCTSQWRSGTAYNKIFLSNNSHGSSYFVPVMDRQSQSSYQKFALDLVSINNRNVNDVANGLTGELNQFGTIGVCASNLTTTNLTATNITVGSGGISGINLVNLFNGLTGAVTGVTTGTANNFVALQSFSSGISASGGTFANDIVVNSMTIGRGSSNLATNIAIGASAYFSGTTGFGNVAIGRSALKLNQAGDSNNAIGDQALASNVNGRNNTAIGPNALFSTTTNNHDSGAAEYNIAIGASALVNNTTGAYNIGIGASCLVPNTTGSSNVAIGTYSAVRNTTGNSNVAIGNLALGSGTAGTSVYTANVAIGANSLRNSFSVAYNVAIGYDVGSSNTIGSNNTLIGRRALYNNITGSQNIAIGAQAGEFAGIGGQTLGNSINSIFIGYQARSGNSTSSNEIAIGSNAVGLGSNTTVLGTSSTTSATIYGTLNAPNGISASNLTGINLVNSFNGFTGNVELANGAGINISTSGNTLTISATGLATLTSVQSLNGLSGSVGLSAGTGINIATSGNTLTISSTQNYYVSVKDYGALGDGITNDGSALQNALNSGSKNIYFPSGTYKVRQTLSIPKDVSVFGDGPNISIIDGALGNCWGYGIPVMQTDTSGVTWSQLPSLVSGLSAGNRYLNFSSPHGLTYDDMIWITGNTWWSRWVTDYPDNKGEFCRISLTEGTTGASIQGVFYDTYQLTGMCLYKISNFSNSSIKNIGIKGQGIAGSYDTGLMLRCVRDTFIENVKVSRCSASAINLHSCFNLNVNECMGDDYGDVQYGLDYGIAISNCQDLFVNGGLYSASRHAITQGTAPTYLTGSQADTLYPSFGIITRNASWNGTKAFRSTLNDNDNLLAAVDNHPGGEYIKYSNMVVEGAFAISGNNITIDGCRITGQAGGLVFGYGFKGADHTIINNEMTTNYIYDNNTTGVFINMGGQFMCIGSTTQDGGVINIQNNIFKYANEKETRSGGTASIRRYWLTIQNSGYIEENIDINIEGNVIKSGKNYPQGPAYIFAGACAAGITNSMFNNINFSNNLCNNVGGVYMRGTSTIANNVICDSNKITNSYGGSAILMRPVKNSIMCNNNNINGTQAAFDYSGVGGYEAPISVGGNGTTLNGWAGFTDLIQISNNSILNGAQTTTNNAKQPDIDVYHVKKVIIFGNVYGSDTKSLTIPSNWGYLLNEKITGSSSGTISTINGFWGNTCMGFSVPTIGNGFTQNEMITGFLSGKTAIISGVTTNHAVESINIFSQISGGTLYIGRNVSISDLGLTAGNGSNSGFIVKPI